jgi:mRNA capping enzyme, catalytic domain/mRNA capping enzyme, C-terminal domain
MEVKDFVARVWDSADRDRFPGPQPVSIERRHFPLLKRQPYLVCEKTDGVRHLLVSFEGGVFLVNRAFHAEPVKIRVPKDTLLDGELVQFKNKKWGFMVHDAVMAKGENLTKLPLTARLDKARAVIKGIIKTAQAPFEIKVKNMIPLESIKTFPALDSFDYETDGLVFTPIEEPIRVGTHETMFKWKPRERITIDFQLKNGLELFVQDRGIPYKEAELRAPANFPDGTILECGYGDVGWFVEKVRTDKTHANNRRTFFRTIVNLRENIKIQELMGL